MIATIKIVLLLLLVLMATITDVRRHKIYNWTMYPGIVLGFILNALEQVSQGETIGAGLVVSLEGFLACGLMMLVCFVFFDVGGGDVKLIAMFGAFLGLPDGIEALLWTFVLSSIVGAAILIWQIGFLRIVSRTVQHLFLVLRARSWIPLTEDERQPLRRWLFLAPSAFAAICIVASDIFG